MICQLLLGYLLPKSSSFVCVLVGWFYDMSILVRIFNIKVFSFLFVCWLVGFMICQFLLGYLILKSSFFVCVFVGWFYDISTLVRIFNTKVFSFLFVCWLVGFMICQLLLGYLIPESSLFQFVCWLVGFMICQCLLGYLIPKSSFFVCVLVGWFYDMSTLVRIFNTRVFSFSVCVLVGWFYDM